MEISMAMKRGEGVGGCVDDNNMKWFKRYIINWRDKSWEFNLGPAKLCTWIAVILLEWHGRKEGGGTGFEI